MSPTSWIWNSRTRIWTKQFPRRGVRRKKVVRKEDLSKECRRRAALWIREIARARAQKTARMMSRLRVAEQKVDGNLVDFAAAAAAAGVQVSVANENGEPNAENATAR
jgi:hypothetical protein